MKFKCHSCKKEKPCTIIVAGKCMSPTRCPWSENADKFCEWKQVKAQGVNDKNE